MRIIDMVLSNSQAGLIDLNLNQQQKYFKPAVSHTSYQTTVRISYMALQSKGNL